MVKKTPSSGKNSPSCDNEDVITVLGVMERVEDSNETRPLRRVLSEERIVEEHMMSSPVDDEAITEGGSKVQEEQKSKKGKEKVSGKSKGKLSLLIPTKSCVDSLSGWIKVPEKFVRTPVDARRESYFRSSGKIDSGEARQEQTPDSVLEIELKDLEYASRPSEFDEGYIEEVRFAFQIPKDYEIRVARKGELIYHKCGEDWVGIPLEHFRAGLRLPLHWFFHVLFAEMKIGLGQLGPNSIRKICAFIARCTEMDYEPTLSLFWSLHTFQASRDYVPLFELHWKGARDFGGILTDAPGTNKGWHREYVKVKGGDLVYLPEYRKLNSENSIENHWGQWSREERPLVNEFIGGRAKGYYKVSDFYDQDFLYDHNLLLEKEVNIPNNMDKNRILALVQRKKLKVKEEEETLKYEGVAEEIGNQGEGPKLEQGTKSEKLISPAATRKRQKLNSEKGMEKGGKLLRSAKRALVIEREELVEKKPVGDVSSTPISDHVKPSETETIENIASLDFPVNKGWLGIDLDNPAPRKALEVFALAPDMTKLEIKTDQQICDQVGEALGVLGTYVLEAKNRIHKSMKKTQDEIEAKEKALQAAKDFEEREMQIVQKIEKGKARVVELEKKLFQTKQEYSLIATQLKAATTGEKKAYSELNLTNQELEAVKAELKEMKETVKKTEQSAQASYERAIEDFKASDEFNEIMLKAGNYHEEGYNDCLKFIGQGNVVDLSKHSVDMFRQHELNEVKEGPSDKISGAGLK